MDKKSPSGRRTKRSKGVEDNIWDCSVCTYKNKPEAFKCLVCDVRKGTSTRKPRINPQLVQQQLNPTPAKVKKEKSDKKISVSDPPGRKNKKHLRKHRNVDRASAETREVTVNNITVTITEYKPIPLSALHSEESESGSEAPSHHSAHSADSDSRGELLKLKLS